MLQADLSLWYRRASTCEELRGLLAEWLPCSILDTWNDEVLVVILAEGLDRRSILYDLSERLMAPMALAPHVKEALLRYWGFMRQGEPSRPRKACCTLCWRCQ